MDHQAVYLSKNSFSHQFNLFSTTSGAPSLSVYSMESLAQIAVYKLLEPSGFRNGFIGSRWTQPATSCSLKMSHLNCLTRTMWKFTWILDWPLETGRENSFQSEAHAPKFDTICSSDSSSDSILFCIPDTICQILNLLTTRFFSLRRSPLPKIPERFL